MPLWCGLPRVWRRTCNREVAGSSPGRSSPRNNSGQVVHTHTCLCSPSSINWFWRKLEAKQALHATHWSRVRGLAAAASVWLRATETEIKNASPDGPSWLGKDFSF